MALAIVISTMGLLLLFVGFPPSFAQQQLSNVSIGVSRATIDPGETISVSISLILEPNSTRDIMVRFVPPQGSVQNHQLHFGADSLGFAADIVGYPNDIASASTQQPGNYAVLIQDVQTARLLERGSFEVVESAGFFELLSGIPVQVLFPIVVAGAGSLFTYWYNNLQTKRETNVMLNQKKAEYFLELRPHYAYMTSSTRRLAEELGKKDNSGQRINYHLCFYQLIVYIREREVFLDKFGAYFLSDPRGEELIVKVEGNIIERLRHQLIVVSSIGKILSQEQSLADLEVELQRNYGAYQLFEKFKAWIENTQDIDNFIRDLKLYYSLVSYERYKLLKDWYSRKAVKQKLNSLSYDIITEFENDKRYKSIRIAYLDYLD